MKPIHRKKNYLVTFIACALFWGISVYTLFNIPPDSLGSYLIFLSAFMFSLMFTFAILFGNSKTGVLVSLGTIGLLLMHQFKLLTLINMILFIGFLTTIELHSRMRQK